MKLPVIVRERLDLESGGEPRFGMWIVDWLDRYWADLDQPELLTNTIAFAFDRPRGMVRIEDDIAMFDSYEVPFDELREYLLARYP